MVAAWINAETGVGPAMASGSQTYSGNWADLPATPSSMNRVMASSTPGAAAATVGRFGKDGIKLQAAKIPEHQEQGNQQTKIADAVDHESFLGGLGVANAIGAFFKPEADQQVGTQPHPFPADKQHQVVIGRDQDHHRQDEEVEDTQRNGGSGSGSPLKRTS